MGMSEDDATNCMFLYLLFYFHDSFQLTAGERTVAISNSIDKQISVYFTIVKRKHPLVSCK